MFLFSQSRTSSKHLRGGYYNLFTVTALKHIALYYLIYRTLDFFDIKWLCENIILLFSCVPLILFHFRDTKEVGGVSTTRWKPDMHARTAAHLLDPVPSQACISLFTNLPFQSARPYSEAMTFQSTVPVHACVFPHLPASTKSILSEFSSQTHAWTKDSHLQ